MSVELFTVATKPAPGLSRLQKSLSKVGLPVTVLGQNERDYWGHGWRWKTVMRAAKASSAETIIHCDGFDTICLEPLANLLTKFAALAHPIVFGYVPQEQPEFWLGLDPGMMIANREALVAVFDENTLEQLFPDHFNDYYQLQSLYSWKPDAFKLDRQGEIFHVLGPRSAELVLQNNRLTNPRTGKTPSFVHGPNNWDLSSVDQWVTAQN